MKRLLAAAALLLSCGSAPAQDASIIACPLTDVPAVGLANLPGGWWTNNGGTNSFLKFAAAAGVTEATIIAADGARILVCRYGTVGTLMRLAPPNANCLPTSGGFICGFGA